jgi:hypothetical protein
VPVVVRADIQARDGPGPAQAGFFGPAGLAAIQRVADAFELSVGLFGVLSEAALDGGGCLVAADAAERLDDALLVPVASGRVGQDDAAWVIGEQRRVGEGNEATEAAAENDRLVQPERVA